MRLGFALKSVLFLEIISSCATVVIPSGGARDTTPPQVVGSYPAENSTGFQDNKIIMAFNEFVELNNPAQNIIISPPLNSKPKYTLVGKKLHISFPEELKPNSTYSIQLLSGALKDFNEANPLHSHRFRFSTGSRIDTQELSIQTQMAKSNQSSSLTVCVLTENKNDFFTHNYRFLARGEKDLVVFDNLDARPYYIYSFVDSNQNWKWDQGEFIGFCEKEIMKRDTQMKVQVFRNEEKTKFAAEAISTQEFWLSFSQDIYDIQIENKDISIVPLGFSRAIVYTNQHYSDSTITINYNQNKKENISLPHTNKGPIITPLKTQESRGFDAYFPDSIVIPFNTILTKINPKQIHFKLDTQEISIRPFFIDNRLIITGMDYGKNYTLTIDSFALFGQNMTNKTKIQIPLITAKKEEIKSEVNISLDTSLVRKKAIVYWINQGSPQKISPREGLRLYNLCQPTMEFHIIIDENHNGHWDSGNIYKARQPEPYFIESITLDPKTKDYILKITNP